MQGDFSFDALFGNLLKEHFPSFHEKDGDSPEGTLDAAKLGPGHHPPLFPAVDKLLDLFKDSCKELIDLRRQVRVSGFAGDGWLVSFDFVCGMMLSICFVN